ncbi:MAG: GNAT family N-acetyltransferase [Chthoniobacterales bacterium]
MSGPMMRQQLSLTTERLELRPFTLRDATRVRTLAGDERIYRTTAGTLHPYGPGMAERWIASHQTIFYEERGIVYAICLKNAELIGAIDLRLSPEGNCAELGFWIGRGYWNRGYCTEAARAMIAYGFGVLKCDKISARHLVGNLASGRVLEKIGMKRERLLPDEMKKPEQACSVLIYSLNAPAFKENSQ